MPSTETWASGEWYEPYIGRWSREVAQRFLGWLAPAAGLRWLDVGCGTGALAGTVLQEAEPEAVVGVEPSPEYRLYAQEHLPDERLDLREGSADALPVPSAWCDYAVSGLVLNFVPDPVRAVAEMARACRPGGTVACYVWDYAEGMQMLRHFWDAAARLDPAAAELDEGARFPLCRPDRLAAAFAAAGLTDVETGAVEVTTRFGDFDDFWTPFLGGQGPAPGYCATLTEESRTRLADLLRSTLPADADGTITLTARAWTVQGLTE